MNTILWLLRLAAPALCLAVPLPAAITVSVDMDPATPGIQSTRAAHAGQVIAVDLVLAVGAEGVSSYGVSMQCDTAELAFNGSPAVAVPALPGGLAILAPPVENGAVGGIFSANGVTLSNGPANTSLVIATINFTVVAPGPDTAGDITPGFFNSGVDGCYDNVGDAAVPTFVSGNVDLPLVVTSYADAGPGSLRATLASAAARSGPDTITFDPALSGGTIALASEIVVDDADGVAIDGSGLAAGLTLDGGPGTNRIISVNEGASLTLRSLTLTGGGGGGVTAAGRGGAIHSAGALALEGCTLVGNTATIEGGAVHSAASAFTARQCTVTENSAVVGGGFSIADGGPAAVLQHVTLSGNTATGDGSFGGGGLFLFSKTTTLTSCLIAQNTSPVGPDVNQNAPAVTSGTRTLIGDNATVAAIFPGGPLVGSTTTPLDPGLAPLGNYGGPTQTMALLPGSPARNAATGSPATSDQRGFPIVDTPDIGAYEAGTFTTFDAWIWERLPATATAPQHAASVDFDYDGAANDTEWLTLTDPASAASVFAPISTVSAAMPAISFRTVTGRTYTLEGSDTLESTSWTTSGLPPPIAGTGAIGTFILPASTAARHFFRVQVRP